MIVCIWILYLSCCILHFSKIFERLKYPNTSIKLITVLTPAMTPSSQAYSCEDTSFKRYGSDLILHIVPPPSPSHVGNNLVIHCINPYTLLTTPHHHLPPLSFVPSMDLDEFQVFGVVIQNNYIIAILESNFYLPKIVFLK